MSDAEKHKYTMGNAEKGGVPARIGKEDGVQDDVSLSEAGSHTCVPPPCPPSRSPCPSSFLKRGRSTENVPKNAAKPQHPLGVPGDMDAIPYP